MHEPSGLEPFEPGGATTRAGSSLLATDLLWRLEQGSTSGLESLGGSSRLGQGSTSRLDSRLEPLGGFLAVSWRLESRGATSRAGSSPGLDSSRAGS